MLGRTRLLAAYVEHDVSGPPWIWIQTARDWLSVAMSLFVFGLLIGGCVALMIFDSSDLSPAEPGNFDCGRFPSEEAYNACVDHYAERFLPQ